MRTAPDLAVIVLAGGAGRRMGGRGKPVLPVGGEPMLARVLAATTEARVRVVVGPSDLPLPPGVGHASEQPAGAGPVAAVAAGLAALGPDDDQIPRQVAVLAGDLPFLTPAAIARLREALARTGAHVAVYRDSDGQRQLLCGVWWESALQAALPDTVVGAPVRALFRDVAVAEVDDVSPGPPPWYDCDTPADLEAAQEWATAPRNGEAGG